MSDSASHRRTLTPIAQLGVFSLVLVGILALLHWHFQRPTSARIAMANGQYSTAAELYRKAAHDGDRRASNSLGNLYYLGLGVTADYQQASKHYYEAAVAGVADAQMNIGHLYKQGLGVEHDPMRAFAWYHMADVHGNVAAEFYMKQITEEWTLSPLQISTALEKWSTLPALSAEGL